MSNKGSILVVDDECEIREGLELLLKTEGYQVSSADTGQSGLTRLDRRGDLHTGEAPAEAAAVQLGEQCAVAAADLERAPRMQTGARAEREHVIGLPDRAERAPARVEGRLGRIPCVALVIELDQLLGVFHRADDPS